MKWMSISQLFSHYPFTLSFFELLLFQRRTRFVVKYYFILLVMN